MYDALILKAAAGELMPVEEEWLRTYAEGNPAARFDLALLDALPGALQVSAPPVHARVGLDAVMRRVAADQNSSVGLRARIAEWLGGTVSAKAFVGACALVVVQLGVLGVIAQRTDADSSEHEQFRTARSTGITHALVRVSFHDNTTEQDMRYLLVSSGARIVAGPTQMGSYYLSVRKGSESDLARTLRASALVSSVQTDVTMPEQ